MSGSDQYISKNKLGIVSERLEKGTDANGLAIYHSTAHHLVAKMGNSKLTKPILKYGKKRKNSLVVAVCSGDTKVVQRLLDNGAKVDGENNSMLSPLHYAAYFGQTEIATLLLEYGARTDISLGIEGTALHMACKKGCNTIVKLLINRGSDVNSSNDMNETPLHFAIHSHELKVVQTLLEFGASVNCADKNGYTPLDWAIFRKFYKICELLIKAGANIQSRNEELETPLHSACRDTDNECIIQLLVNSGATVNARNNKYESPLFHTVKTYSKSFESVKILLNSVAYPDMMNKNGFTPLMLAVKKSNLAVARTLLQYSADTDLQNDYGETALHIACMLKNKEIVELLLSYGADININNLYCKTPVMIAFLHAEIDIQNIISDHIVKLKCANLYVSQDNREFTEMISNETWSMLHNVLLSDRNISLELNCNRELNNMKLHYIPQTSVTIYNLLTGSINRMFRYARNNTIWNYFKENTFSEYPLYRDLIIQNLKKGFRRCDLITLSYRIISIKSDYFSILPYTCVEYIFHFLDNRDLILVMNSCNCVFKTFPS